MTKRIFMAMLLLASAKVFSQDSTSLLNEVVVTANKYPAKSSATGKVIKVITREQLEKSGGKDLSQVLMEQTGILVGGANSNPGKDKSVYIRGAKVDYTLITIDGVPVYDPSGIGSNFDIRLLSLDQIHHVEVLMGSQSTLYGSDAMAGVINIITKKPDAQNAMITGNISYGSNNMIRSSGSMSLRIKKWDYQIQIAGLKTAGIDEAVKNTTKREVRDRDAYDQMNVNQILSWQPSAKMKASLYHRTASFNQSYDQGAFVDELDLFSTNKNTQAGFRYEYKPGKLQWFFNYNYHENQRRYIDDSTESRNGYDIYSKGIYNSKEHFADLYSIVPVGKNIRLTLGSDYRQSNSDQYYLSISPFGPYENKLGSDSLKQHQIAMYGSAVLQIDSTFFVEAGTRWNKHSVFGTNQVFSLSASKFINANWKLFANYSEAYKTPSLYQLFSEYGNRSLKPEQAKTWEFGTQVFSANKKSYVRALYFQRDVKDVINFYTNPVTYASNYINQDKQKDHGIEAEALLSLGKRSVLRANYTYVTGNITTQKSGKDTVYNNLYRRPKTQLSMSLENQLSKSWFMSVGLVSVGNRSDLFFDNMTYEQKEVSLGSYVLLNMYVSYQVPGRKWHFYADMRNLSNEPYSEAYGFNALGFNGNVGMRFAIPQERRTRARKNVSLPSNVGNKKHRRS